MDDQILYLEKEYCPPLDSALLRAILFDFDLTDSEALREARTTLDALKESAEAEEAAQFDPSASSKGHDAAGQEAALLQAPPWSEDDLSKTSGTDSTSLTGSSTTFSLGKHTGTPYDTGIDDMSVAEKVDLLAEMFPDFNRFDIRYSLEKNQHNFGKTAEDLLSLHFLRTECDTDGEKHNIPMGLDGFADSEDGRSRCKGKGKKGRRRRKKAGSARRSSSTPALLTDSSPNLPNRWEQAKLDVDFITQRSNLTAQTVMSVYNKNGHSLGPTILAICDSDLVDNPYATAHDPIVQVHAIDLASEFPTIPPSRVVSLVLLAHPSTASARELAEAVISSAPPVQLTPQYLGSAIESSPPSSPPPARRDTACQPLAASATSGSYALLRSHAFAQASAAYRKSRSQPLMGGAAGHYASVGHAANAILLARQSADADARVAAQSSADQCDLHGVVVRDAVEIAKRYVQAWWDGRGEYAREGKVPGDAGYRIVVGRGTHSDGGRGRLGPAVAKMLKAEGWRLDHEQGVLVVRGRTRK